MVLRILIVISLTIFLSSCSKKNKELIYSPSEKINPYDKYEEGLKAFKDGDFFFANKKFTEAELNFAQPKFAAKSAIMASYSLYGINFYKEAEESLENFLRNYPTDKNIIYAHYLLAIIYFEQIGDEKNDLKPLIETKKKIDFFLEKYPNTEYSIDLKFKRNLLINQFAAKELYIAKYYISVQKWVPAINRLKLIIRDFDQTVFVEEALHRLVEIHYHLGLENEAKKYASVLGYNYNSSDWFKQSYKILNKDYNIVLQKKENTDKTGLLKRIIKIIK